MAGDRTRTVDGTRTRKNASNDPQHRGRQAFKRKMRQVHYTIYLCERYANRTASKVAATVTTRLCSALGRPQPTSPLLRLPGEVRNMIYAYVFSDLKWSIARREAWVYTKIGDPIKCYPTKRCEYFRYEPNDYRIFALTQTCRQIRAESRLLPYKYASYWATRSVVFSNWLMGLNMDAREAIRVALQLWI